MGSETVHPQGNTITMIMVAIAVPSAAAWCSADCMSNGDDHCDYYYCTAGATRHQVHNAWYWRDAVDSLRQTFHRPCMHSASRCMQEKEYRYVRSEWASIIPMIIRSDFSSCPYDLCYLTFISGIQRHRPFRLHIRARLHGS